MQHQQQPFTLLDLKEVLRHSGIFADHKEELGPFYSQQFQHAVELWQNGQYVDALPVFDSIYKVYPHFFVHRFIRMVDRLPSVGPEALLAELTSIDVHLFPERMDRFLFHFLKAGLYFMLLDIEDCIASCKEAMALIVDVAPVYIMLGDCYALRGRYTEAISTYKIAKGVAYYQAHIHANIGYAYLMLGKYRRATRYFLKVVDVFTDNDKLQFHMAQCYVKRKKYKLALVYLDRAELLHPNNAGIYYTRGFVLLQQKNRALAITTLQKAVELGSQQAGLLLEKLQS